MTLPLALVERWPGDAYKARHTTIESALKHNVTDIYRLWHEVKELRAVENYVNHLLDMSAVENLNKQQKVNLKKQQNNPVREEFRNSIIARDVELNLAMKESDYPAMVMAAYPESKFLDKTNYWKEADNITGPVLIRGISNAIIGDDVRNRGQDYYFIETGYLGNYVCDNNLTARKVYHRIVKNAMQHNTIMDVQSDRWDDLVKFNPNLKYKGWKTPGKKILVILSTNKPFDYYGEDHSTWANTVVETLKKYTDREIIFREKRPRGKRTRDYTIYDDMDNDVYAVVTYNSIAAVEAIHYGIPAFSLAPTAADPVGNKDLSMIENPHRPDKKIIQKWLWSLAYSQFSLDEIITGQAWKIVLENDHRPTINY